MATIGAIAAIIAALTGTAALVIGIRERKHRRLIEIVDLVAELQQAIDYGGWIAGPKGKLQSRLGSTDLPKTRALLSTPLRTDTASSDLCRAALEEARAHLAKSSARRWQLRRRSE